MVRITIDTEKDSVGSLRRIIQLIEYFIQERSSDSHSPISVNNDSSVTSNSSNNLFDAFNDSSTAMTPNSSSTSSPSSNSSGDMFAMFNDELPSSKPNTYAPSETNNYSSINSNNLSAQDLLSQSDSVESYNNISSSTSSSKKDSNNFFDLMEYD